MAQKFGPGGQLESGKTAVIAAVFVGAALLWLLWHFVGRYIGTLRSIVSVSRNCLPCPIACAPKCC